MKKTDALTWAIGALLFVAMLCYIGFAVARRVTQGVQTTRAAEATFTRSVDMTGLIVRSEQAVFSNRENIDVTAVDGRRVAAGETIATAYASPQALDRAVQLRSLSEEIAALESQADEPVQAQPGAAYEAVDRLAAAMQGGDPASAAAEGEVLAELLLDSDEAAAMDGDYLRALKNRYNQLLGTEARDSETITAPYSGLFGRVTDGLETLTPSDALALTPSTLRAYMEETTAAPKNAIGKLVDGYTWYYAALMASSDAAHLHEGDELSLRFSRYCAGSLRACVERISAEEGGECVVVFALDEGMAQLLSARRAAAALEYESYTGLRVPQKALYRYWVGYMDEGDAANLAPGDALVLMKGSWRADVTVSEIEDAEADGRCRVVVYWPWTDANAPPTTARDAAITAADTGAGYYAEDYYEADEQQSCLCVFTMTGRQAERRRVSPVYVGDEWLLVSSQGADALRAGNEIIVSAANLYDGLVFD